MYQKKFGDFIPLIRRSDGSASAPQAGLLMKHASLEKIRNYSEIIEAVNPQFLSAGGEAGGRSGNQKPAQFARHGGKGHTSLADRLGEKHRHPTLEEEEAQRRLFLLQVIPAGSSGSWTDRYRPLHRFAAAFATHSTSETFLVGTAASIGAGISMGFAEALSDDGKLTGRGHPLIRGLAAGIMTTIGGLMALYLSHSGFHDRDSSRHHHRLR